MSNAVSVRPAMVTSQKFTVFDADGLPIYVGDTLHWQETAGRYGETRQKTGVVTHAQTMYGMILTDTGTVQTYWEWRPKDGGPEGLYCRHTHHDWEHGHETWARVVRRGGYPPGMQFRCVACNDVVHVDKCREHAGKHDPGAADRSDAEIMSAFGPVAL